MPVRGIAVSAVAIGSALALLIPMSATAATPVSQGEGRLLVATLAGAPLTPVLDLAGASAVDTDGTSGPVISDIPLDASVLSGVLGVTVPSGVNLFGDTGIIKLGAVGQYAQANDDGSSVAFSGTVSQAGNPLLGIGTPSVTGFNLGTTAGGSAEIGIGDAATAPVSINAQIGALAASAVQPVTGPAEGHYLIDNVGIVVGGTLVSGVTTPIDGLLTPVLNLVNPLLGGTPIADPLAGGQVTISVTDLLAAAGVPDLNSLPPGTDLLSFLPAAVVAKVTALANGLVSNLQTAIAGLGAVGAIADGLLTAALPGLNSILSGVSAALTGPLGTALTQLAQLKVNNQTTNPDGSFTENALTVGVGPAGSIASVQLANATVGPNAGPTTPGNPGGPGTTAGGGSTPLLAETGLDLPIGGSLLGAALLAAAGVALTRLAARRRQAHQPLASNR